MSHDTKSGKTNKVPRLDKGVPAVKNKIMLTIATITVLLAVLAGMAISAQDKYTVKVPGGLAFSEFRGYEGWQAISISRNEKWSL